MKIALIAFGVVVALLALIVFGSMGLSRLVRWIGWSQDSLMFAAMLGLLITGTCVAAWRFGCIEDDSSTREVARTEREKTLSGEEWRDAE